ncbi:hypothetical protein [Brevundimonas sp.]|uniref:hypothetical protein n=1 Tax=Brevundimonas sp. TaxID=1871086 RepID=UPI003BA95525
MRGLSSILGLFSVMAVLMLGASGAWASERTPMACHESVSAMAGHDNPAPKTPAKAMVMACCIACVTPAIIQPPASRVVAPSLDLGQPARLTLPLGRSPAPEPGPPKA